MLKKPPDFGGLTHKIRKIVFSCFCCPVFAFLVSRLIVKGIAIFAPWLTSPLMFHKSHGACIARQRSAINVVDEQPEGGDIDPSFTLFTTSQCLNEPELHASTSRLQRFSHKYALAVLMANACGSSALWDESGQLIVRADCGSLLLTGLRTTEGWQGDIIPLR